MRNLAQKPLLLAGVALVQVMACEAAFAQAAKQQEYLRPGRGHRGHRLADCQGRVSGSHANHRC